MIACDKKSVAAATLTLALLFCLPAEGFAHSGLHEKIQEVSRRIERTPEDPRLYFQRAELHRHHRDWRNAELDYDRAAKLDPRLDGLQQGRARMLIESGRPEVAVPVLSQFLEAHPDDAEARALRARAHGRMGDTVAAFADFDKAIALSPEPELYLERARVLGKREPDAIRRALRGLEEGMERLGAIVPLQLYAIELELARDEFDQALARLKALEDGSEGGNEPWLALRGEILMLAGRNDEARGMLEKALRQIEAMPERERTSSTRFLERRVRHYLEQLDAPAARDS